MIKCHYNTVLSRRIVSMHDNVARNKFFNYKTTKYELYNFVRFIAVVLRIVYSDVMNLIVLRTRKSFLETLLPINIIATGNNRFSDFCVVMAAVATTVLLPPAPFYKQEKYNEFPKK